jgi:hypothetical protein
MNDRPEEMHTPEDEHQATTSPTDPNTDKEPQTSSRRELIERYAKAAVIAAPLILFVSKAHAIHSKPV